MTNEPDENQWIQRSLDGDTAAFSLLVLRYQDAAVNLACRITGNRTDGEDLAQEAFIRAYRKLHQFDPRREFRGWLLGITANLSKNHIRRRTRREQREQLEPLLPEVLPDPDPRLEQLTQAMEALSSAERAILTLKYMEGYSVKEIAAILELRESAVKMRLARARTHLMNHPLFQKGTHDEPT